MQLFHEVCVGVAGGALDRPDSLGKLSQRIEVVLEDELVQRVDHSLLWSEIDDGAAYFEQIFRDVLGCNLIGHFFASLLVDHRKLRVDDGAAIRPD